jgi:hypothetical protein
MLVLVDENVPDSVAAFFRERGHDVLLARDHLAIGALDSAIAASGDSFGAILVTWDKDFSRAIKRRGPGWGRFRRLGRITFGCPEHRGRQRLEDLIESIEFEYEQAQKRKDPRLMIEIRTDVLRILR